MLSTHHTGADNSQGLDRKSMTLMHMTTLKQRSRYRLSALHCSARTKPDLPELVSIASETESWGNVLTTRREFDAFDKLCCLLKQCLVSLNNVLLFHDLGTNKDHAACLGSALIA